MSAAWLVSCATALAVSSAVAAVCCVTWCNCAPARSCAVRPGFAGLRRRRAAPPGAGQAAPVNWSRTKLPEAARITPPDQSLCGSHPGCSPASEGEQSACSRIHNKLPPRDNLYTCIRAAQSKECGIIRSQYLCTAIQGCRRDKWHRPDLAAVRRPLAQSAVGHPVAPTPTRVLVGS